MWVFFFDLFFSRGASWGFFLAEGFDVWGVLFCSLFLGGPSPGGGEKIFFVGFFVLNGGGGAGLFFFSFFCFAKKGGKNHFLFFSKFQFVCKGVFPLGFKKRDILTKGKGGKKKFISGWEGAGQGNIFKKKIWGKKTPLCQTISTFWERKGGFGGLGKGKNLPKVFGSLLDFPSSLD